ncbi:MAG: LysR family transcriptional regulator [Myxococcales bacterium]|nr:LysR family transcriptional regulator [Myxococcales bacterium]
MEDILAALPTLVSLAETGSVSRTARQLDVPRSTVSRRLARLETALGVVLAERTTRSFRLTKAGRQLAEGAAGALAQLRTVREAVEHTAGSVRGWLRVCSPPGLAGPLLGRFFMRFRTQFPDVRVELTVREHVPHLLDEAFDVAFATGPLEDAPWVRHHVGRSWVLAVAQPAYLNERGRPASLAELEEHVLLATRSGGLSQRSWPTPDGEAFRVDPHMVTNDLSAVVDAARAGTGIALVPVHLVAEDLARGQLEPVLPRRVGRLLEVYLLYLAERRDSPLIGALRDSIDDFGKALAQELPTHPDSG